MDTQAGNSRKMLKLLIVVWIVLWAAPSFAQTPVRPALFVVRDADSAIYLFGTVHVRRPGSDWGGAAAQAALAESDEVWTEIDIDPDAAARSQSIIMRLGMAPADQPLSSRLTEAENRRLNALLARLRVPRAMIEPMQPWFAGITLSIIPMVQAGYDPDAGVDQMIDTAAEAAGKRMRSFETLEQQLNFMAELSAEAQHEMLLEAIDQGDKGAAELDSMSAAWESGDVNTLEALVVEDTRKNYPELYGVLIRARNDAWMEVLRRELDGAGVDFIAVGAGHIVGRDGLVAQFRARGFTVERVE
jgi:uncharacterized protein YbaP (TraB family)